jgi:hypothetical protein
VSVTDGTNGNHYAGDYVENQATVTWSGTNLATGFTFTSNPGDFSTSVPGRAFAELGHEGNGSFFDAGSTASVPGRAFAELSHEGNGLFVGSGSTAAQEAGARAGTGLAPALVAWASPRATTATTLLARPQPADGDPTRAVGSAHVILVAPGPDRSEAEAAHPKALDQVFADLAGSTLWDPFGGHEVRAGDI